MCVLCISVPKSLGCQVDISNKIISVSIRTSWIWLLIFWSSVHTMLRSRTVQFLETGSATPRTPGTPRGSSAATPPGAEIILTPMMLVDGARSCRTFQPQKYFIIFYSRMRSEGSRFTLGVWGWGCVRQIFLLCECRKALHSGECGRKGSQKWVKWSLVALTETVPLQTPI